MTRLPLDFQCADKTLAGTLDTAPGTAGLLIVSGGNEVRAGPFGSQSRLAARIAAAGFPVFRFDRRGIGDSEGENRGFLNSKSDIEAATKAFRALSPQIERLYGFGNCDAASALVLHARQLFEGLVLANPWTQNPAGNEAASALPPAAIRARYLAKLGEPGELWRLMRGRVDWRKLAAGIARSLRTTPGASPLSEDFARCLARFEGPTSILLAEKDRTAQEFLSHWDVEDPRIALCNGADHSFSDPAHQAWLEMQILAALRG